MLVAGMAPTPQRIRLLPDDVANKIAAGEVVERPASVVKELMENALDADTSRIEVAIVNGGTRLVSVSDNGCGMNRDDALLCLERHATSKIRTADDIEHIGTMGFRGEAMAAIASVSRLRLATCERDTTGGTEIVVNGGKLGDVREVGVPSGTCVEVRDLFFNIPARRKFLRTHQTELGHARVAFLLQAIAHPAVGMGLKVDGKPLYELPAGGSLEDRLRDLFGADYLKQFKKTDHAESGVRVHGYVGLPSLQRNDRQEQYFFVNGRPTTAPVLHHAVREGYHTLMPHDRYPLFFLFMELDPGQVDINVHPAKREVRFRRSDFARNAVVAAIRKGLDVAASAGAAGGDTANVLTGPPLATQQTLRIENLPSTRAFQYPRIQAAVLVPSAGDHQSPPLQQGTVTTPAEPLGESPWTWCRVLGQVGGLYVVLETSDGLVLMDPHAAHERVMFERYMADLERGKVQTQGLLLPETVELQAADASRVRRQVGVLKDMGFGISDFGGDAFVVDSLPACLGGIGAGKLLQEIAAAIEETGPRSGQTRWREEAVAQAACKAAVKARDTLSLEQIEQIVKDLAATKLPFTCPHGRPTMILTSFKELNRRFGRE